MQVQVFDNLPAMPTSMDGQSESMLGNPLLLADLMSDQLHVPDQGLVLVNPIAESLFSNDFAENAGTHNFRCSRRVS